MPLRHLGFIDLPPHAGAGGFDHAAVHERSGRVYVAHTANDAVDVLDVAAGKHVGSVGGLPAVAGALAVVSPELIVTSNRGENTVGVFTPDGPPTVTKIGVGVRPNGLALDPSRGRVLAAHVGDPGIPGSCTVSLLDLAARRRLADVPVAGRTRWTIHDPVTDAFFVNIMDPPQIAVLEAGDPFEVRRVIPIPHAGPHGLDIDVARRRLYCACDAGVFLEIDADRGTILAAEPIAGVPDVVFFNPGRGRVYVAIGALGVIEVFDTARFARVETVTTEPGAHTLSFDGARHLVCAFLPATHRAAVYEDRG
jgi:DNA-binding beta-propeller fold protein YncE